MSPGWIANATLLGASGEPRRAAVAVGEGRIVSIAGSAPPGAQAIDARGMLLLPAFVDAHVHLTVAGKIDQVANDLVRSGVCGVLDLGEPEEALDDLRAAASPLRIAF